MAITPITNLRGPAARIVEVSAQTVAADQPAEVTMTGPDQGRKFAFKVPRGLPGLEAVPTDEAMSAFVGATDSLTGGKLVEMYGRGVSVAQFGASPLASAATNTAAFIAALATGEPVFVPGGPETVYMVNEISSGFTNSSTLTGEATLRMAAAGAGILQKTGISGFRIDGLTFDGDGKCLTVVRFIDCTAFNLGTTTYINGQGAGVDLQECVNFDATLITANMNGRSGSVVGAGVYIREKSGGTGCKDFRILAVRGDGNGLGAGLDGAVLQTAGSNCRGSIGQITAKNSTRYGCKFMHTGGFVEVGIIHAEGNAYGVSTPGVNGLSIGSLFINNSSDIGFWLDAASKSVSVSVAEVRNSGRQGCQIWAGATDINISTMVIHSTDTRAEGGSNGRGLDVRGITRGKIGNLTVVNAGGAATNTSDAFYVAGVDDLKLGNVTVYDTRAGFERAATPGNFFILAGATVSVGSLRASNLQAATINNLALVAVGDVSVDGKRAKTSGVATVASGQTSVTVTHGLLDAPAVVVVTGSTLDTAQAYVSAKSATTLVITVPSAVGAARAVYWTASTTA